MALTIDDVRRHIPPSTLETEPVAAKKEPKADATNNDTQTNTKTSQPLTDPKTGVPNTIVKHTVENKDTVSKLVTTNPVPMTLKEFYQINPQLDRARQDGKRDIPPNAADPDTLAKGQVVYLKGPPNDAVGQNTQREIAEAKTADKSVSDLQRALGPGKTDQTLKDRQTYATQQRDDVKNAVDYELRLAANSNDPKALAARREQVENYLVGDPKYTKLVKDSAGAIEKQSKAERNTDIQRYEVDKAQRELQGLKGSAADRRDVKEIGAAETKLRNEQAELREAVGQELDEHFRTLGAATNHMPDPWKDVTTSVAGRFTDPKMQTLVQSVAIGKELANAKSLGVQEQIKILNKRLPEGSSPELKTAVQADPNVQDVVKAAAQHVENGYNLKGMNQPTSPHAARQLNGLEEGSKRLKEMTDLASPWLAGQILKESQPTIDKIWTGAVEGAQFPPPPGGRAGVPIGNLAGYSNATANLSAAVSKAAQNPENKQIVDNVAKSLVNALPADRMGKVSLALQRGVRELHPDLALSVISQLKAAGRTDQANRIATDTVTALGDMRQTVTKALDEYDNAHLESLYLKGSYGFLQDPSNDKQMAGVEKFWADYAKDHPELAATQKKIDAIGDTLVRTMETVSANQDVFKGLEAEGDLKKAIAEMPTDKNMLRAMGLSESAMVRIAQGLETGSSHSGIAQLGADNIPREARTLLFRSVMVFTGKQMATANQALELAKQIEANPSLAATNGSAASQYQKAVDAVSKMQKYQDVFGYSNDRQGSFVKMIDSMKEMIRADQTNDLGRLKTAIQNFEAASTNPRNGVTLYPTTVPGLSIRVLGLALAGPIALRQLGLTVKGEADMGTAAQAFLNGGLFTQQSLFILGGLGRLGVSGTMGLMNKLSSSPNPQLTAKLLMGDDWLAKGLTKLSHYAEPMAMAGALVEAIVSLGYIGDNNTMAALHFFNAAGNASVALGYAKGTGKWPLITSRLPVALQPWLVGGGAALVTLTALGIYAVGKEQEASKFETQTTSDFLKLMGVDEKVAHQLRNQNSNGASPGPVLHQLAIDRGMDLSEPAQAQKFLKYLNDLGADKVAAIVGKAHHVNPNDQGQFPASQKADELKYLKLPMDPAKFLASPEGKGSKIYYDEAKKTYRDPDTGFIHTGHDWTFDGHIGNDPYRPLNWDPSTGWLTHANGSSYNIVNPTSMDGLKSWMISQGLALPSK